MANSSDQKEKSEDESTFGGPTFSPPLYRQRYGAVLDVARRMKAKKVIDMGCAECKLLRQLKREEYIEELVGVDIDFVQLKCNSHIVFPLTTDYLHPRTRPLKILLMQGSITEADARLLNFDLLSCVEVIEHLDKPILDAVPNTIFGVLRPRVVVMTTPNVEFNVLFPGLTQFRHYDHRFEWTRSEFHSWCTDVTNRYGYTVEFSGVGSPPAGREEVGYCSQMAIFTQSVSSLETACEVSGVGTPYTIISESEFPYDAHPPSPELRLCKEAEYYLNVLAKGRRETQNGAADHEDDISIKLEDLLSFPRIRSLCSSIGPIVSSLRLSESIQLDSTGTLAVFSLEEEKTESLSGESDSELIAEPKQERCYGKEESWEVCEDT